MRAIAPSEVPWFAWRREQYVVTTDPASVDVTAAFMLLRETHWGTTLTRPTLEKAVAHSIAFSLLDGDTTIGSARVVTDQATFAYLCDVVIAPSSRGRGLGQWMVACILDHPALQGLRRFSLMTRDARWLYERFGFTTDAGGSVYMERKAPAPPLPEIPFTARSRGTGA